MAITVFTKYGVGNDVVTSRNPTEKTLTGYRDNYRITADGSGGTQVCNYAGRDFTGLTSSGAVTYTNDATLRQVTVTLTASQSVDVSISSE